MNQAGLIFSGSRSTSLSIRLPGLDDGSGTGADGEVLLDDIVTIVAGRSVDSQTAGDRFVRLEGEILSAVVGELPK